MIQFPTLSNWSRLSRNKILGHILTLDTLSQYWITLPDSHVGSLASLCYFIYLYLLNFITHPYTYTCKGSLSCLPGFLHLEPRIKLTGHAGILIILGWWTTCHFNPSMHKELTILYTTPSAWHHPEFQGPQVGYGTAAVTSMGLVTTARSSCLSNGNKEHGPLSFHVLKSHWNMPEALSPKPVATSLLTQLQNWTLISNLVCPGAMCTCGHSYVRNMVVVTDKLWLSPKSNNWRPLSFRSDRLFLPITFFPVMLSIPMWALPCQYPAQGFLKGGYFVLLFNSKDPFQEHNPKIHKGDLQHSDRNPESQQYTRSHSPPLTWLNSNKEESPTPL